MKLSDLPPGPMREAASKQLAPRKPAGAAVTLPAPEKRASVRLVLPMPPSLNSLYATVRGRRVLSREGRRYKAEVASIVAGQRLGLFEGPVKLAVKIYRPRRAGDLDGYFKSLADSLTGQVYKDDSQIVEIHAERFDDKANPRAEIIIAPAGESLMAPDSRATL